MKIYRCLSSRPLRSNTPSAGWSTLESAIGVLVAFSILLSSLTVWEIFDTKFLVRSSIEDVSNSLSSLTPFALQFNSGSTEILVDPAKLQVALAEASLNLETKLLERSDLTYEDYRAKLSWSLIAIDPQSGQSLGTELPVLRDEVELGGLAVPVELLSQNDLSQKVLLLATSEEQPLRFASPTVAQDGMGSPQFFPYVATVNIAVFLSSKRTPLAHTLKEMFGFAIVSDYAVSSLRSEI